MNVRARVGWLFMILSISAILLIAATYLIISVTPLKEYMPGYDSTALRRQAINNTYLIDSLQQYINLVFKPTIRNRDYVWEELEDNVEITYFLDKSDYSE